MMCKGRNRIHRSRNAGETKRFALHCVSLSSGKRPTASADTTSVKD
jgi:hypothetical protein